MPHATAHDPELFMISFGKARAGDKLVIKINYMQPLSVSEKGSYTLQVRLSAGTRHPW